MAWIGPIGAGTVGFKIAESGREKREIDGMKGFFDVGGHFAGQQFGGEKSLRSHGVSDFFPVRI